MELRLDEHFAVAFNKSKAGSYSSKLVQSVHYHTLGAERRRFEGKCVKIEKSPSVKRAALLSLASFRPGESSARPSI
jgi:hypothetical protein